MLSVSQMGCDTSLAPEPKFVWFPRNSVQSYQWRISQRKGLVKKQLLITISPGEQASMLTSRKTVELMRLLPIDWFLLYLSQNRFKGLTESQHWNPLLSFFQVVSKPMWAVLMVRIPIIPKGQTAGFMSGFEHQIYVYHWYKLGSYWLFVQN